MKAQLKTKDYDLNILRKGFQSLHKRTKEILADNVKVKQELQTERTRLEQDAQHEANRLEEERRQIEQEKQNLAKERAQFQHATRAFNQKQQQLVQLCPQLFA